MPSRKPIAPPAAETDSERNLREALARGATIVPAVGLAFSAARVGTELSVNIEAAMLQAAAAAQAEGITDPDEIRKRVLAARQKVKDDHGL